MKAHHNHHHHPRSLRTANIPSNATSRLTPTSSSMSSSSMSSAASDGLSRSVSQDEHSNSSNSRGMLIDFAEPTILRRPPPVLQTPVDRSKIISWRPPSISADDEDDDDEDQDNDTSSGANNGTPDANGPFLEPPRSAGRRARSLPRFRRSSALGRSSSTTRPNPLHIVGMTASDMLDSGNLSSGSGSNSDAMIVDNLSTTPRLQPPPGFARSRSNSVSTPANKPRFSHHSGTKTKGGLSRIADLLKAEVEPFQLELAHENATTSFLKKITPTSGKTPGSPESHHGSLSTFSIPVAIELNEDSEIPLPRTIPIANAHLKDPTSYVSNSSRLNPENSVLANRYQDFTSSPSLSPVIHPIIGSPVISERKKRKMSFDDRFEPYKRNRIPNSPGAHERIGSGSPMALVASNMISPSAMPHEFTHPSNLMPPSGSGYFTHGQSTPPSQSAIWMFPSVAGYFPPTRQRSASGSSVGSAMSTDRFGQQNLSFMSQQDSSSSGTSTTMPPHFIAAQIGRPGSPRVGITMNPASVVTASPVKAPLGQMLNMTGAQGGFSKMSLA